MLRRYVHGLGSDDPLVWYEGSDFSQPRYLHTNHQGSVVAIAQANGVIDRINRYDEYGIPGADPVTGQPNLGRFQYTGQAWLPELGLYHYKARIYSPTLGRFLQVDPIGYEGGVNLYGYAEDDPVSRIDPKGTFSVEASSAADAAEIVKMINSLSKSKYEFDKNNKLRRTGSNDTPGKKSGTYSDRIDSLISSENVVKATVAQNVNQGGVVKDIDTAYGGGVTFAPEATGGPTDVIVTGNSFNGVPAVGGGTLNQTPAEILMHELAVHASAHATGTEDSIGVENKIRSELGLPQRATEASHPK